MEAELKKKQEELRVIEDLLLVELEDRSVAVGDKRRAEQTASEERAVDKAMSTAELEERATV